MIYIATTKDLPELLRMSKAFFDASPYRNSEFSMEKVQSSLIQAMENPSFIVLLLGEREKNIGVLVGLIATSLFNNNKIASDLMWWIDPEYRNASNGALLYNEFQQWAVNNDCKNITMAAQEDENIDRMSKLYEKLGYRPIERSYTKEVN